MVVPTYQDGKSDDCPELSRDMRVPQKEKSSRKKSIPKAQPKVSELFW